MTETNIFRFSVVAACDVRKPPINDPSATANDMDKPEGRRELMRAEQQNGQRQIIDSFDRGR